ncbi:condensation domain-containing protein [Actinospica robiniae]|uniref:condensation domain-containing protein n=1 Tax=Actinospica robiniae TaxID=304901 RepID=UPI0004287ACB|nr:condensation domain-containing protein [Actinospica robiniae]
MHEVEVAGILVDAGGGRGGGTAVAATWAQYAMWQAFQELAPDHHLFNIAWSQAVPPGTSRAAAERAGASLVVACESLRTRLIPSGAGLDQVLDATGCIHTSISRCTTDDVANHVEALQAEMRGHAFDCATQWPIRIGWVMVGEDVARVVFTLAHTAVDGWAAGLVSEAFANLLAGHERVERPGTLQPREVAAYEQSEQALRRSRQACAHASSVLADAPERVFRDEPRPVDGPAFREAVLRSRALGRAATHLGAETGVGSAVVLLAGFAEALAAESGTSQLLIMATAGNRTLPGTQDAVCAMARETLLGIDCGDPDFSRLLPAVAQASLRAYRNGHYDKREMDRAVAEAEAARGTQIDRTVWYNDRRRPRPVSPSTAPTARSLAADASRTRLTWPAAYDRRLNLTLALDVLDTVGDLRLSMIADTRVVPAATMSRMLYRLEATIVSAALSLGLH